MHGNAVAALACHLEFILPTNFTNVYRCAMFFFSHRLHRFYRFFILIIRFALLLCKNRSVDLHRFYRCAMFFFAHKFHEYHECLLLCDSFFLQILLNGRTARASQRGGVVYMNIFL